MADYTLAPGVDPASITLTVTGATRLALDGAGALTLHTAAGDLTQSKPVAYQTIGGQRVHVDASYTLRGTGGVGVAVGAYDASQPLVIDPVLSYSSYLGGSGRDEAHAVAVDGTGNIYVAGNTGSTTFPTTPGAPQGAVGGGDFDAFVVKLSPDGHTLLYSTYLAGTGADYGRAIAVNGKGNAYVAGATWSPTFPTTAGAYQPHSGSPGLSDAFVAELATDGRSLVYGTYLGGGAYDDAYALALDGSGDAYVAGATAWDNLYGAYPTTANAYQTAFRSTASTPHNAVLSKLSPDGSQLLYSTFLGGTGGDQATGVAVDGHNNAYVAGLTNSPDFPVRTGVPGASSYGGGLYDAFVTKIDTTANGSAGLVYSMYLGGSGDDYANTTT